MKKVLKIAIIIVGGVVALAVVALAGLVVYGSVKFKPTLADRPLYPISADTSPEGLARGKYLVEDAMGCTDACHTPENGAPLSGMFEEMTIGPIWARFAVPNLTPDPETGLGGWTDAEIARAIREGVDKNGVELVIMPASNYHALSDADVAAIVGYLRQLEPVKNPIPTFNSNIFGKVMLALGAFGPRQVQPPITAEVVTPPKGTVEYGKYMVKLGGCSDCHNPNLTGGPMPFSEPGAPMAANLTPGGELVGWTVDDFIAAVHTGVKPGGKPLAEDMPRYTTNSEDLAAIFTYLQSLPASPMAK